MPNLRKIDSKLWPDVCDKNNQTQKTNCLKNMRKQITLTTLLCTSTFIVIFLAGSSSAKPFTATDFEGKWNSYMLGVKGNLGAWGYGTLIFDANGSCIGSYITSTGHSESPSGTLSIDRDGIIKALDFGGLTSTFHGVMSNKKDMMVSTGTGGDGSYQLHILVKSGGTFSTSDLEGTWVYHVLIASNEPYQIGRWWHCSMKIDKSGNAVFDSPIIDSEGSKEIPHPLKLSITEGGIITELDYEDSPLHGAMNQSKDMMVTVDTVIVTSIDDVDIPGDALFVGVKQVPGTYNILDLAGTWYVHGLVSGDSYDDWIGWYHVTELIDRYGNGNFVTGSYLNSSGDTNSTQDPIMSITSNGIITILNAPTFHGIINLSKDMFVGTMDDGGGGYGLAISVGRPAFDECDFDMDGDVDFADFAIFAEHWLK